MLAIDNMQKNSLRKAKRCFYLLCCDNSRNRRLLPLDERQRRRTPGDERWIATPARIRFLTGTNNLSLTD